MRSTCRLRRSAACTFAMLLAACGSSEAERGGRLFAGELPIAARIAGHETALPPHASRCANCHATAAASARPATSAPALGGTLSPQRLASLLPRRGGPPSRFDESSLCRLLRTGVDPAHVVISSVMPRYEVDEADCRALWAHLSRPPT